VEYGKYLASTCTLCHGPNLNGQTISEGGPDYLAPNLTPGGEVAFWSEEQFIATLRTADTTATIRLAFELLILTSTRTNEVLRATETGIFHARVKPGLTIAEGGTLGVLKDFFGKTIQEVRAPFSGVILYVVATPPVSQGEPLAMVGHLKMP